MKERVEEKGDYIDVYKACVVMQTNPIPVPDIYNIPRMVGIITTRRHSWNGVSLQRTMQIKAEEHLPVTNPRTHDHTVEAYNCITS